VFQKLQLISEEDERNYNMTGKKKTKERKDASIKRSENCKGTESEVQRISKQKVKDPTVRINIWYI
jgi:hypothetical protein